MNKSVLFVTPYFKPRLGGVETHVYELSKQLIKKGWKVSVLTEHLDQPPPSQIDGIELMSITILDSLDKKQVWQQVSQYERRFDQFDVIHVHDVAWWLAPWLFKVRKKLCITFHGWEGTYPVRWQAKLQRLIFSLFAQGTIHVGDFIQEFYWDRPTVVTYGGIPSSETFAFKPVSEKPHFIFFGRLEKENAIAQHLKFFQMLKNKGVSFTVTWVGDGSYRNDCEEFGKVTGMIAEPKKYIKDADFVCANSYLSILDAQSSGKVVCSLYQHKLKQRYLETYPGNDSMIIAGTPDDLYLKVIELIGNKRSYQEMSSAAYAFAQTQTWEKVAQLYEKLWSKNL